MIKRFLLLLILSINIACDITQKNPSSSSVQDKDSLIISTTKSWEETGSMCVNDNGDIYCWGIGGFSIDEGQVSNEAVPTKVPKISGQAKNVSNYNANYTCVINKDTSLRCTGRDINPNTILFSSGVTKVDVGANAICAIVNSSLKCWGRNDRGILGDGTFVDSTAPVDVIGMNAGVTDVSVGLSTACAVKNGAAYCWGYNAAGELGNGTTTTSASPVAITSLSSGVTDISASYGSYGDQGDSVYAIKDGALYVWGKNDWGQLGDGTAVDKLYPTLLTPFTTGITQVDAGGTETCFQQNNDVYCFGFNLSGQMGILADSQKYTPQKINGLSGEIIQIAAGSRRGCAVTVDKVYCWGMNSDNVIDNTTTDDQIIPKIVYSRK